MIRAFRFLTGSFWLLFSHIPLSAQLQTPYILNGAATQRTCNCYVLTEDLPQSSGTVWNKHLIDLNNSFDYYFDVNLGCKDETGADGIAFILQTQGTNLGASGNGIGFQNIRPSLGVLIDTWQNSNDGDPSYDHVSINMNGDISHTSANNLAGPVTALDGNANIEDCKWHIFRIRWDAVNKLMEVSIDGVLRVAVQKDLVAEIFGGSPMVYWGFGAATGAAFNKQQFCAALRPELQFDTNQLFCDGTAIVFEDDSKSFGTITRWLWDFGDGTTSTIKNPPPHLYARPGEYDVRLVIEDNSGCTSDTMNQHVVIGSYPIPDFITSPPCTGRPLIITNQTRLAVGAIQRWEWDLGNGQTSNEQHPVVMFSDTGVYNIRLQAISAQGCNSDIQKTVTVHPTPQVSAVGGNTCIGSPVDFAGTDLTPSIPLDGWFWDLGNGDKQSGQQISYIYPSGGTYEAGLHTVSIDRCFSDTVYVPVTVTDMQLYAGNDTLIARDQPLQLHAAAQGTGLQFAWWPATGLTAPDIADPIAYLQQDQVYYLTVTATDGCVEKDTINVKVYAGPEFYIPSAFSPNNDGRNDVFRAITPGVSQLDFFCVWDRWGQEVFRTQSLSGAWDGSYKGVQVPPGTYVWMIQGMDYNGQIFNRKGTVTIVR